MVNKDQRAVTKASGSQGKSLKKPEPWSPESQARLAVVLGQLLDIQKTYGKGAGQLENILAGFCFALEPYPADRVIDGLAQYMRERSDFPTPADIVAIIDPKPPEWKPDKPYYVSLKKIFAEQGPYGLGADEIEYISRYEEFMRKELRDAG